MCPKGGVTIITCNENNIQIEFKIFANTFFVSQPDSRATKVGII